MSELIDRYLAAVAANLAKKDRGDIVAELRDVLTMKIEAREEELGRPLDRREVEALLKAFGHPLEVAGRYGKAQHLIGPAVYPFYVFALKATLLIVAALYIAAWFLDLALGGRIETLRGELVPTLMIAFAAVTLTAAAIDRYGKADKLLRNWKPSQLPMLGAPKSRSPFEVLLEVAMAGLVTLWWVGLVDYGASDGRGVDVAFAPIWDRLYWPFLVLLLSQIALGVFELVAPGLVRLHAALRIAWHLGLLPVLAVLFTGGHWFDLAEIPGRPGLAQQLEDGFDRWFQLGLAITFLVIAYEIGRTALRYVRAGRSASPAPA